MRVYARADVRGSALMNMQKKKSNSRKSKNIFTAAGFPLSLFLPSKTHVHLTWRTK